MAPKFTFAEGEKVLCFHGPLIYEAKCLKRIISADKFARYFLHYTGWNKSWDEWVPESRMLKYNETNLQMQKQLLKGEVKNAGAAVKSPGKRYKAGEGVGRGKSTSNLPGNSSTSGGDTASSEEPQPSTSSGVGRRKKRVGAQRNVETVERFQPKLDVRVTIPEELKIKLADDWDIITRQRKVSKLPATPNIDSILENFLIAIQCSPDSTATDDCVMTDVILGIKAYFNVSLGSQLLYKFERPQYKELIDKNPEAYMSQLYGGIHLLRLFVKIGPMLSYTTIDEKSMEMLLAQMDIFLKYMVENRESLLNLKDYHHVSREYRRSLQ